MKKLKQVTDRFNLFNDGRRLDANGRKYVIKSVQSMIKSKETQELLRLGEAYGYYGHGPRTRANKLNIRETEFIMIGGKPILVENVPAVRTVDISCSDDGIVTHTHDFLSTPTGKIALSMWESNAGGFSWVTSGSDGAVSHTRKFYGMDYVKQPNYISIDHPSMMLESIGDDALRDRLISNGFSHADVDTITSHVSSQDFSDTTEHEQTIMMLESVNAELANERHSLEQENMIMREAFEHLPVYMTDSQREALNNIRAEGSKEIVQAMLESLDNTQHKTLPCGWTAPLQAKNQNQIEKVIKDHIINFDNNRKFSE